MDAPWACLSVDRSYRFSEATTAVDCTTTAPARTSATLEASPSRGQTSQTATPPPSPSTPPITAIVPMEAPPPPSTSSLSSNSQHSHSHSHSQQSSLDLDSPSLEPALFDDGTGRDRHGLSDYCADLEALMEHSIVSPSPSPEPYRHGQIGAFRHFRRFDQASRPIVSDNWRAKSTAADSCRPQLGMLVTTGSGNIQHNSLVYTPTRSPLAPDFNGGTAGFSQQMSLNSMSNIPPTPVSLSTPVSMAFSGHSHHSSTGSLGPSPLGYSPTSAGAGVARSVGPGTSMLTNQMGSLGITGYLGMAQTATTTANMDVNHNPQAGVPTFPVALPPDALGYCFVRPNGMRTRLVPVDMLPVVLYGIPAHEIASDRLVALPVPAGVGADGRSSNTQALRAINIPGANGGSGDAVQTTIDRILAAPAAQPPPPPQPHSPPAPGLLLSHQQQQHHPSQQQQALTPSQSQFHIQSINNNNATAPAHPPPKRVKVYCDKWVHEGVCAFTQQGCKYKHEMPADRATQHQLGLFLGYPAWWKRRQAELARVTSTTASSASSSGTGAGANAGSVNGGGGDGSGSDGGNGGGKGVNGTGTAAGCRAGGEGQRVGAEGRRPQTGGGGATGGLESGRTEHGTGSTMMTTTRTTVDRGKGMISGMGHELSRSEPSGGGAGLAASRWGPTNANRHSSLPATATATAPRSKPNRPPLPSLWQTAAASANNNMQNLQCYDGAEGYHGSPAPVDNKTQGFGAGGSWPWDLTQRHAQLLSAYGYGPASACSFVFHSTAPPSPFGPIAPPPRSAQARLQHDSTAAAATPRSSSGGGSSMGATDTNTDCAALRGLASPYAGTLGTNGSGNGSLQRGREQRWNC